MCRRLSACLLLIFLPVLFSCFGSKWDDIEDGEYSSYVDDEYEQTCLSLDRYQQEGCIFIGFITDLHCPSSSQKGVKEKMLRKGVYNAMHALSNMTTRYNFSLVAFGGDYVYLPTVNSDEDSYVYGTDCVRDAVKFSQIMLAPTILLRGNHEFSFSGKSGDVGMSAADFYSKVTSKYTNLFNFDGENNWSYYDDDNAKIRYLFLDIIDNKRNLQEEQWIRDIVIPTIPQEYSVMIFSHVPLTDLSNRNGNHFYKWAIDKIKEDGHDVIACVSGHVHSDWHMYDDDVLYVSTLQAGYLSSNVSEDGITYEHKKNSYEESAFDVIAIDKKKREIHFIRFGLGKDRTYNY